ncbi:MAG: hypothetical protein LBQ80_02350 [Clostridium sp.]|nr:hypothetical protein [Clostridium sp.]
MLEQEERLKRFLAEIITEAEDRRGAIIDELRELREKEREQAQEDARQLRATLLSAEEKRLTIKQNAELSAQREELRKALARKREELASSVLASAREKIKAFAAGKDYSELFERRALRLCERFKGREFTLLVRAEDLVEAQALVGGFEGGKAEVDPTISLGGCRLKCGSVTADDSLDARLELLRGQVLEGISLPEL